MLSLYYVRGINRLDTPTFTNIARQEAYFSKKLVTQIDSWYPPHYKNTIMFESVDLNFNSKINYLSLTFNDKTYYYFIDDLRYINEDLIEVDITMDTIQTYMFDIQVDNLDLIKKSIQRWNVERPLLKHKINRDFIRENVSNGYYDNIEYDEPILINDDNADYTMDLGWIIVQSTQPELKISAEDTIRTTQGYPFVIYNEDHSYSQPIYIYLIPLIDTATYKINGKPTTIDIRKVIDYVSTNPEVQSMNVIRYNPFKGVNYIALTHEMTIQELEKTYIETVLQTTDTYYPVLCLHSYGLEDFYKIYAFDFVLNDKVGQVFDIKYIPQLLDENYIEFKFGERLNATGYPLHQLDEPKLYSIFNYDVISNNRIYKNLSGLTERDKYITTTISKTIETMAMYNDAWKTYQSQHYGSLTTGMALQREQNIYNTAKGVVQGLVNMGVGTAIGSTTMMSSGGMQGLTSISDAIQSEYALQKQYQITKENMEYTPNTEKMGNSYQSDIQSNSLNIYRSVQKVNDIEHVARTMESYGYKVAEHYSDINPFEQFNVRHYYNVVQVSNMNLTLNIINDNVTIERIKNRFKNGLRLWNIDTTTNETFLPLGKVCYYDNVEEAFIDE